jgi:predicted AlkP superfamily pyrophosphatase or phosphodiesterase
VKALTVIAAGLGFEDLEKRKLLKMAGLDFKPATSVFPAVTCVAQASFRTAAEPIDHAMTSNGYYSRELCKPFFWEQSSSLVKGPRIWDAPKENGLRTGLYFWQQSFGENADTVISPAPIHKHGGGMVMRHYTKPSGMSDILDRLCGTFPLHRYWGPLASPKVGRYVIDNTFEMLAAHETDVAFLYLPTLDYEAQRFGPDGKKADAAYSEFVSQLSRIADWCSKRGVSLSVCGDYQIGAVDRMPSFPNAVLRSAGLFNVRHVAGRAYPDFAESRAFAMCDHEVAHVYVKREEDVAKVRELFESTREYESVEERASQNWANASAGEILLLAKKGSWCAYPWWTDVREEPDYAGHVDIHNKPGYDPCELFFGGFFPPSTSRDFSRVKGTHGRVSKIAYASTVPGVSGDSFVDLASCVGKTLEGMK